VAGHEHTLSLVCVYVGPASLLALVTVAALCPVKQILELVLWKLVTVWKERLKTETLSYSININRRTVSCQGRQTEGWKEQF
jgi:hypothetical protein